MELGTGGAVWWGVLDLKILTYWLKSLAAPQIFRRNFWKEFFQGMKLFGTSRLFQDVEAWKRTSKKTYNICQFKVEGVRCRRSLNVDFCQVSEVFPQKIDVWCLNFFSILPNQPCFFFDLPHNQKKTAKLEDFFSLNLLYIYYCIYWWIDMCQN